MTLTNAPPTATQATGSSPNAVPVEAMFSLIMDAVRESHKDISELRKECHELRLANAALERQVREGLQWNLHTSRNGTPGFMTPAPASPRLLPKSPFLSPPVPSVPSITTSGPETPYFKPSPLGDNALTAFPYGTRDIPGFYVVIPAGGAGTRLWPLSREGHPKFLLDLTLKGRSLIQATWDRLLPLSSAERTTIVAGPSHVRSIREQLPDLLPHNLFTEPGPKDSMAAIGLAAAILAKRDPQAIIGSFAADHMISGDDAFLSAVAEAVEVAKKDFLVTIGIAPSHPSTGFGYVRLGDKLGFKEAPNARLVSSFKEKPDARTAASYIATGNYRWNAGMFVTKATFLLELLKEYQPELHDGLIQIAEVWDDEVKRQTVLGEVWPGLEKIPIDNAVAEPAAAEGRVAVVPATFGWDDVGDFSSLADLLPAEANQPRVLGDSSFVLTEQVAGGIVVPGSGRLITCLGVDDLVIVDMPDTLLVTTRARSQEVKRLVKKCRDAGHKDLL
ncbi:mannose-1-phosphate guanylyltransferase [Coprinopsis cinerea okayama7|uniref:Mannose-1-phosphate guanylyltransferase n=1 Tax=Coprinopsis cinerea (strain Okayama-7 / 130 / ATCC MYA-4618 / FGSC 9003) TaxID=240176 RepID=A8N6C8_COPC7|nr:mannose-1-phosphate guanylyltransferase [Coprinopsis cinerea okayama7\|eukprot:XP_001830397.1 mannose-1-phosphate guanylyltransferase [Coprinopsis cinerea okayama7\